MKRTTRYVTVAILCAAALAAGGSILRAATIAIPNYSFESPATTLATPFVDFWQQVPEPDLSNQNTLLTGVFSNVPPPIDNCDGGQAVFLFAVPGVALFQDYDSIDYAHPTPLHAFAATFDVGKSYTLTVGVIGGGGNMTNGATLELSLYYRDALSNIVNVAATNIAYTPDLFPSHFHLVDFQVLLPTVRASDQWAGRHIGVQLLSSITDTNLAGGYWDLDNVRLASTVTPVLLRPAYTNGHFSFTLQSEPGLPFEILASTNVTLPLSNWTSLGTLTNVTGATAFTDSASGISRRFYRAKQVLQ
jgi:hypothetical protein